jgi:glycolate oxidase iron-sulfur subunit
MDTTICAKCGACSTVCPVYQVTGREELSARGRLHLLGKMASAPHSAAYLEIFSRCLLCGACRQACPRAIDLPALVVAARHDLPRLRGSGSFRKLLATGCLAHPTLLANLAGLLRISGSLLRKLPAESGLRLKLGIFLDQGENSRNEAEEKPAEASEQITGPNAVAIFPGCLARHLLPEIGQAADRLLAATGHSQPHMPKDQTCCGLAAYSAGDLEEASRLARRNLDAFTSTTGPIITPCGSCYSHLLSYPTLLADDPAYQPRALAFVARLRELSSYLAAFQTAPEHGARTGRAQALRVFYHDPCHLRFKPGLSEAPRQLLRSLPGLELVELSDGPRCCGLGGTFNLAHPELSERIARNLVEEIRRLAPDLVLTSCSGCLLQLHQGLAGTAGTIKVKHLAAFLADYRSD